MSVTSEAAKIESLAADLPDQAAARRFFSQLKEAHPRESARLLRETNQGLLSDVLAIAAWSAFLSTTLLQHPEYIVWLGRKRREPGVRTKEELLESLARFALTNSALDAHVLLARFRRRELLRIYLNDIRHLATIAETTEELSNLADACLEYALRQARQELDNRYGSPLEIDRKDRAKTAQFCVVALGKLGSRELNYASDIDLLFLYSTDGATSGAGERGATTNREYFVKLSEQITKIVGAQSNEGAAYRVDLRLRPHGRIGALAISLKEAADYYGTAARDWERQVLIRTRSAAGDADVFRRFWTEIESKVYQTNISVENALASVAASKRQINLEHRSENGFNVKLGKGGIREIEFIAQALQLAHGGRDRWLRSPHTLIALNRLAEHALIAENELTDLSNGYVFLRSLEHRLQMENGLQTHALPNDAAKRFLIARRMNCADSTELEQALKTHTNNVSEIFERVFRVVAADVGFRIETEKPEPPPSASELNIEAGKIKIEESGENFKPPNYYEILTKSVKNAANFHDELAVLRLEWRKFYDELAGFDRAGQISPADSSRLQTALAEASLNAALLIAEKEIARKFNQLSTADYRLPIAVLGLGKLGSRGMDYGSDLDLILIYDDRQHLPFENLTHAELYSRAAEILVTALSSLTREGQLYRVDLRLRPDGKNGASASGATAFLDYVEHRAEIWEWLAYVKLRAAAGNLDFAREVEFAAREIVHRRAKQVPVAELKSETKRVRDLLEAAKTKTLRRGEIDIKHGAGGLLDVYFAVRFLQLRDDLPDDDTVRSTVVSLETLHAKGALDTANFAALSEGYNFLRRLDHALRVTAGRAARIPGIGHPLLTEISHRLKLSSPNELRAKIVFHTAAVRRTYANVLN